MVLYRWTLKNWPEGASSMRSPHTHTGETLGEGGWVPPPGPDAYELLKTPHRLVRSQYCGIVWVKEEGPWRDLEICASPTVGGGRPPSAPFPRKWGGERPPPPPCSYAYEYPWHELTAA